MRYVIVLSALLLSGCASAPIKLLQPEYKIVTPPDSLYDCPIEKKFPNSKNLTNEQVGKLILKLQKNNLTCKNSLDNIQNFMDEAKVTVEKK
jgi:hypothetical protein